MKKFLLVTVLLFCIFFFGCGNDEPKQSAEQAEQAEQKDDKNLVEMYYEPYEFYYEALEDIEAFNDKMELVNDMYEELLN